MSASSDSTEPDDAGGEPRISLITPSYNQARYLRQCLESVRRQSYPNLQHLVIDGGSTDRSVEILREGSADLEWTTEPDAGQASAVNKGLARADGEIIGWLNSDDYLLPGALECVAECFRRRPEVGMVYGRAWIVDEDGRRQRPYPTFDLSYRDLRRTCSLCQPAVFLRRAVIDEVGLLNEALDICLDYEWWLRILRTCQTALCDRFLAASRHYAKTKTGSRRLRALVEAGYLQRQYFGRASWRWSAKWVVHRWTLRRGRYVVPLIGWWCAAASAVCYRRRFDALEEPSRYGRRMLDRLAAMARS